MKKKLFAALLTMIMATCIAACSGKGDVSTNTESGTAALESDKKDAGKQSSGKKEDSEKEEQSKKDGVFWETKEVAAPSFSNISVREQEIVEGVSVRITKTPLDFDFHEIETRLRANSFIKDNYKLQTRTREGIDEAESYKEGDFHDYSFSRSICGESLDNTEDKAYYGDFSFVITTDYANYDNTYLVSVSFDNIPEESGMQEGIYSVLKDALGEDVAEYLTYQETEKAKNKGLEEYIEYPEKAKYYFQREMKRGSEDGTWNISFVIRVDNAGVLNEFRCYDGGITPMLQNAKYNLSTLTEGSLSNWNLQQFSNDIPEYTGIDMGSAFIRNKLEPIRYTEAVADDGTITYDLFMFGYVHGLTDVPAFNCPGIDVSYSIDERDNAITSLKVCFEGENIGANIDNSDPEAFYKRVFSIMKEQIALVCPCLNPDEIDFNKMWDVSDANIIDFDNMKEVLDWKEEFPVTYLGEECECRVTISLSDIYGKWSVTLKSK